MIKVNYPIKYNGGSIYERKDGGGYRAVLNYGGVQRSKTSQQVDKLKVWIDRNSGIVREGRIPLTNSENVEYREAVALLPAGMSLIEAATNVIVGYALAVGMQIVVFPVFGIRIALGDQLAIGLAFTGVSLVRGYVLRRLFEHWRRD